MPCSPKTIFVFAAALFLAAPTVIQGQTTGLVYHESYLDHDTGGRHPETPERLRAIMARLEQTGLMQRLHRIDPSPAPLEALTAIHTEEYVAEVRRACREGQPFLHSSDTPIGPKSYRAALLAAGGVLSAIDAVMAGDVRNAFCAVRPPGHHAVEDRAMGFCLFNNVAIGARYAQRKHNLRKILIVDWDVHHGNGTQAAFYDDPDVLYVSVHQYPFYPGTGAASETGAGPGEGSTLNAPLPAGSGDDVYERVFEDILKPKALAFAPDLVMISAGFDAHEDDLLGSMQVSTEGYARLTRLVRDIAERCCSGRIVSVLEGGYHLEALAASVHSHLSALLEDD
ncbi:MAG: histone deacetylase [Armatimonadota bacterium]